jgi:hypothetical protein
MRYKKKMADFYHGYSKEDNKYIGYAFIDGLKVFRSMQISLEPTAQCYIKSI